MRKGESLPSEYKAPSLEEVGEEERRTKERRGPYRREFLRTEEVPDWLNDIGQERSENDPLAEILNVFRELPRGIQQEIVKQISFERESKKLNGEQTLKRLTFLVEQNDDLLKQRKLRK